MLYDDLNREELTLRLAQAYDALPADLRKRGAAVIAHATAQRLADAEWEPAAYDAWFARGSRRARLSRLRDRGIRLTADQFETLWEMERGDA